MAILKDTIVQGDLSVTGRIGGTFKNIKIVNSSDVEETTIVAGATDDTVIFKEGSGISLTGDATNDKLTINANDASTSAAGIVQLSSDTNSTSESTAATSKAVKAAYDKANHSHPYASSTHDHDDIYYTENEINTLLSGKADSGHNHSGVYAPASHAHTVDAIGAASVTHTHGNITTDGKLSTASSLVVTDKNKYIATTSIDPANLVQTSDSRLSDARTPKSHTHGNITNDGKLATAGAVVVTNEKKELFASTAISTTELSYLDGVTSNIQDQLNAKATAYDHGDKVPEKLTNGKLFFLHD